MRLPMNTQSIRQYFPLFCTETIFTEKIRLNGTDVMFGIEDIFYDLFTLYVYFVGIRQFYLQIFA